MLGLLSRIPLRPRSLTPAAMASAGMSSARVICFSVTIAMRQREHVAHCHLERQPLIQRAIKSLLRPGHYPEPSRHGCAPVRCRSASRAHARHLSPEACASCRPASHAPMRRYVLRFRPDLILDNFDRGQRGARSDRILLVRVMAKRPGGARRRVSVAPAPRLWAICRRQVPCPAPEYRA